MSSFDNIWLIRSIPFYANTAKQNRCKSNILDDEMQNVEHAEWKSVLQNT